MDYLFTLGRQIKLSTTEIEAVLSLMEIEYKIKNIKDQNLVLEIAKNIEPKILMKRLGGTIKIGEEINTDIAQYLEKKQPTGKIQFSISGLNKAKKMGISIKKELKEKGRSIRFVEANNTATILHNNLVEKLGDFTIFENKIFVTKAIQPIEEFTNRDYERPGSDGASGMLPPKLSRIMINLSKSKTDDTILDPFCGSGTILMEAAEMGYKNLIGSDISEKAFEDTKKNMEWLVNNLEIKNLKFEIVQSSSQKLDQKIKNVSIDKIISEPYMGRPLHGNESEDFLRRQTNELAKLYIESFKSFYKLLKPGALAVFIIPAFKHRNNWIEVNCVEGIKKIGFATENFDNEKFLLYHRPNQHLGRQIWKFVKK